MSQVDNRNSFSAKRARTDGSRREDDWTCPSCGNVNFSFRTTCNMRSCTQTRPSVHNSKSAGKPLQAPQSYSSSAPYVGSRPPSSVYLGVPPYGSSLFNSSSVPPYEAHFSGGPAYHYNYGSRLSGGSPYQQLHSPAGPPSYSSGPMIGNGGMYGLPPLMDRYGLGFPMAPPPMLTILYQACIPYSLGVFLFRSIQLKHGSPFYRSTLDWDRGQDFSQMINYTKKVQACHLYYATRDDDWKCPKCGNINFSFRTVCNMRKCSTPKPGSQTPKSEKSSKQKMLEGSWKCEKCSNINYPFRTKCNRQNCGAEKPAESKKSPSPNANEDDQFPFVFLSIDLQLSNVPVSTRTCLRVEKVQSYHPPLLNMGLKVSFVILILQRLSSYSSFS
ncbi:RanBP2-type zinc finger protein [Hibiscus syriacus]|uniref:RanBP2-type zinc finger protein n=1 Tax=Hibiscus syriacus TaxID=106335 RepID=A0A6A2Z9Q5_HIBSY|nr:RanBP2-type zinc finger protein [Hibiscus syriacus]